MTATEVQAHWGDILKGLRRAYYQREGERIQQELAEAEKLDNIERVRKLLLEKTDLIKMFKSLNESSADLRG